MTDAGAGLYTRRLTLRRFTAGDLGLLERLYGDEESARYVGGMKNRAECQEMLDDKILSYYERHPGLGIWVTLDRQNGAALGMHLLNHIRGETLIQVGYSLLREYWGRGYATEMCAALLDYGFATLGLPRIHAITDPRNEASQRVLLKCGLGRRGERNFPAYSQHGPQAFFEYDRNEWLLRQPT